MPHTVLRPVAATPAATVTDLTARATPRLPAHGTVRLTGAQIVLHVLREAGIDTVFGIPGGAVLPLYQRLGDTAGLRHILVRHEQGAGHAASGYAQATGRIGVCLATSGPGATNLVTPLMDAGMDSVPVLAITGQVPSTLLGTSAFQETDICAITRPVTKSSVQVTRTADLPSVLRTAVRTACSGRPGPVLVDITKDALLGTAEVALPMTRPQPPAAGPVPAAGQVDAAARTLLDAARPVLYVGGGVVKAEACLLLRRLARMTGAPVVTTLMARGAFPDTDPLHLGMPGMHGTVTAVTALQRADLVMALGARFDDRVTGRLDTFAPHARVVHIDIDRAELSRKRQADIALHGDCRAILTRLCRAVGARLDAGHRPDYRVWWENLSDWRARYPVACPGAAGELTPSTRYSGWVDSPRAPTPCTPPGSASTRCGPRNCSPTPARGPSSPRAVPGPWATRSPPPWEPSPPGRGPPCGRSTATAPSR